MLKRKDIPEHIENGCKMKRIDCEFCEDTFYRDDQDLHNELNQRQHLKYFVDILKECEENSDQIDSILGISPSACLLRYFPEGKDMV